MESEVWATGIVAEILPVSQKIVLWPEDSIETVSNTLDGMGEKAASRRNYFLVDVSITPAIV